MNQLSALMISMIIESLVAWSYGRFFQLQAFLLIILACAGTLLTHPFLWLFFKVFGTHLNYIQCSILGETGVIFVEGIIFRWGLGYSWHRSFLLSLITNTASYLIGMIIHYLT